MRKPGFCLCENKVADQLRSNCDADQRLCLHCSDSTIPPILITKISSSSPSSRTVQVSLYRTRLELSKTGFLASGLKIQTIAIIK